VVKTVKANEEKAEAYAQYYLRMFREAVRIREAALSTARKRLAIAEREYASGRMVTGEEDGVPPNLRGILKP
jgi:hypothetical protein